MDIAPKSNVATPSQAHPHVHSEAFKHWVEGMHIQFPTFKHDHPPVINVNKEFDERLTLGQRIADKVATTMGSWRFIISQALLMIVWITLNLVAWFYHWDIYPFVLLNLAMSAQAAFATPLIMMSQNRQSEKDRLTAQNDYITDCKGEEEIRHMMDHLDHQDTVILQILQSMDAQHKEVMLHLSRLDPELARRLGTDIQQVSKEIIEEETGDGGVVGNP
jgi:uncharacterized membrane protein